MGERGGAMSLVELLATTRPGHRDAPWSWDDEERDIATRVCLCCDRRGHYQKQMEAYIAEHGLGGMGVCLEGSVVWDGHHRIIASKHLGISVVPLESREDADARWVQDHGTRSWEGRLFGDVVRVGAS